METRLGGSRAKDVTDRLPFDGAIHTNTIGYAGGLWLLWNTGKVEVSLLSKTEQEIHVSVKVHSLNSIFFFSAIYASPRLAKRHVLWNNLCLFAELHNMPWVIAGDFNESLSSEDKFGGRAVSSSRSLEFKECLDSCNMIDLGFSGPRFTWTNKMEVEALIQERINRFFVNPSWCTTYPDAKITHLTRCHSDHYPILLESYPTNQRHLPRPFKFQSCWLADLSFPNIVSRAWRHSLQLGEAIDKFVMDVSIWNKNEFGNVFVKKKRIMARLHGIQKAMALRPSAQLVELEKVLQQELDSILNQERDIWALKSRVNWLVNGERNTSFFHVTTLVRRKRNRINAIKNTVGEWVFEEEDIMNARLTEADCLDLNQAVTDEEITVALRSMKPYKAPGPDGLHAGFFQRFWLTVGSLVKKEVRQIFATKKMPEYLNKTHLILIPKIQGPETLGNYRPISLCNTTYKLVTKILVNRIKPVLGNLISPVQTAFIPGRRGTDNAIIVQELIHSISKAKGKEGYMAIKIDLVKAYDKLEWDFIRERLFHINLPTDLIDLIMSCISTATTSILFNGGTMDPILPSRGIRQGDPLSPYIFILCMDWLGQLIEGKCAEKLWNPVKSSKSGPSFSHLFFTDDLVLFAKANQDNCSTIRDVLDEFCDKSGQSVSEAKSRVFFSPNVDRDNRESLSDILGFQSTRSLGKYIGIPIRHPGSSSHDFDFILDQMKQKLAGWKANLLSMAGRRLHWIGWHKVTKTKKEGGLGFQTVKGRNTALLAKLNWRLHSEKDALWTRVLKRKYCSSRRINSPNPNKLPCSQVWKGIKKGAATFVKGARWSLGKDSNLNFWSDSWSELGPLRSVIQGPIEPDIERLRVKDILTDGSWDWNKITMELPTSLKMKIQATPSAMFAPTEDKLSWSSNPRGVFDLKSAYSLATDNEPCQFDGEWIWKARVLPKIKFFAWKCMHNSVGVKACLAERGMSINMLCPLCVLEVETIAHALRDCRLVREVWFNLGVARNDMEFFNEELEIWMTKNAKVTSPLHWDTVFLFAIWILWQKRNLVLFQKKPVSLNTHIEIIQRAREFIHCGINTVTEHRQILRAIRWERPNRGWVKLNTDGSSSGNPGPAGCVGVLRDENGNWLFGFSRKIGITTSFVAELWAVREGLSLCLHKNFPAVVLELDAKSIYDVLTNPNQSNNIISAILDDCRQMMVHFPQIRVRHCYREVNRCADKLARMGVQQPANFCLYEVSPQELQSDLDFDNSGLYVNRRCPEIFSSV
nr:uncharacterized protein LOC112008814 [Quercus suber]